MEINKNIDWKSIGEKMYIIIKIKMLREILLILCDNKKKVILLWFDYVITSAAFSILYPKDYLFDIYSPNCKPKYIGK